MTTPTGKPVICPVLISRKQSLEQLLLLVEKAFTGKGRAAFISGEAGIGKSRLLTEVSTRVLSSTQHSPTMLQGRCFEGDHSFPYAPIVDLVRAYLNRHHPSETQLAELFEPAAPLLYKLLPEVPKFSNDSNGEKLAPEQEKRLLWQGLANFFFKQAQPLLILIEDLHWSDEASLDFLLYFARQLSTQPIMLLMTYRREETERKLKSFLAQFDRERLAYEEILTPLTMPEVDSFIQAIFELNQPVPAEFLEALYQLTEGNPFFLEEILKSLTTSGVIFHHLDVWQRRPVEELSIPRSVEVVVQHRTDRLSREARQLLGLAAVSGRRFDFKLLQTLNGLDEQVLLDHIKELIEAQLIIEESADLYAFRHALTRQAVYSKLLRRERKNLHLQIAKGIQQVYGPSPKAYLADLAYHYFQAEEWGKVVEYGQQAGEHSQALYSPGTTILHLNRVLEAASKLAIPPSALTLRLRGQAYELLGEFELARTDYAQALQLDRQTGEDYEEWNSLLALGSLWRERDYLQAGQYFQQALEVVRRLGEQNHLATTLNLLGNWYMNMERPLDALRYHREVLTIFQQLKDRSGLAATYNLLGVASFMSGDLAQSLNYCAQASTLFRELRDYQGLVNILTLMVLCGGSYIGNTCPWPDLKLEESLAAGEEALALSRQLGWRTGEAVALIFLAQNLGSHGNYQKALEYANFGLLIAHQTGHQGWILNAHYALGAIYGDLLDLDRATEHLEKSLEVANKFGSPYLCGVIGGLLASVLTRQGYFERAGEILRNLLSPTAPLQTQAQRHLWCAKAELELATGHPDQVFPIVDRLVATASSGKEVPRLWLLRAEAMLALKQDAGKLIEAEVLLREALATSQNQEYRSQIWRISLVLGQTYQILEKTEERGRTEQFTGQTLTQLAGNITDPALKAAFENRVALLFPSVRVVLNPTQVRRISHDAFDRLTRREKEIATLIGQGKSNRIIATELVLSERTVGKHVENILSKLSFSSRSQIALWAVEKGLVKLSPKE
ncbi:MAG TPA: tetratricopeptide repeat protein [Chloroflexia bacterium]|nr:tetratricopeptide repeat protein [Chloroflexia bacterium]